MKTNLTILDSIFTFFNLRPRSVAPDLQNSKTLQLNSNEVALCSLLSLDPLTLKGEGHESHVQGYQVEMMKVIQK